MDKKFNGTTVETNGVRSIAGGGTGAATAEQARINLGITGGGGGVTSYNDLTDKPTLGTAAATAASDYAAASHKSSHATGGADALTPADIGAEPAITTLPIDKGGTGAATAEQARINLGAAASSHPHSNATATTDGFMSAVDKAKLDAATTFYQLGADIDGEAAGDQSGWSVSINAAGDIVAIGAITNDGNGSNSGHARVYKFVSGSWVQQGADIDGEVAGDQSGFSVSLNAAGDIVAIGAIYNDGNGSDSGHVRVYKFISGSWAQQGLDIDGEAAGDYSGENNVSLNAAGDIVVIGAGGNNGTVGNNSGHARVYKFVSGSWVKQGADIDGEAILDQSGYSVSINAAGDIVAIGANANDGNGATSGHVRVYKFISGSWIQQGLDIDGEAASDDSGIRASLNAAGDIVAIGAINNDGNGSNSGHVRVYKFVSGSWVKQGADIDGEAASDEFGSSVSLNAAGDIVAIGARSNDGNGTNSGHVRVYKFVSGSWVKQGLDIDGEAANDNSGCWASLNAAGDVVAVAARWNGGNGSNSGHVRVHTSNLTYIAESYKASLKHTHLLSEITQSGATTNQVPVWNGTAWVPATPASGGGSGGVTSYNDLTDKPTLGTAAATASTDYATAAQGTKADSALQSEALTPYRTSAAQDTIDGNKVTNGGGASTIAVMTMTAYNALAVKDNNTIYILT